MTNMTVVEELLKDKYKKGWEKNYKTIDYNM